MLFVWLILIVLTGFFAFGAILGEIRLNKTASVVLCITFVAICFAPFYYEFPVPESEVVTFENGEVIYHPYGIFTIGKSFSRFPRGAVELVSTVTPITENPKVQHFTYVVEGRVADPKKFYRKKERRLPWSGSSGSTPRYYLRHLDPMGPPRSVSYEIAKIMGSAMYEFNEKHSREIANFSNPLDPNTQAAFGLLVERYAAPVLKEDGIEISFARFNIE